MKNIRNGANINSDFLNLIAGYDPVSENFVDQALTVFRSITSSQSIIDGVVVCDEVDEWEEIKIEVKVLFAELKKEPYGTDLIITGEIEGYGKYRATVSMPRLEKLLFDGGYYDLYWEHERNWNNAERLSKSYFISTTPSKNLTFFDKLIGRESK